MPDNPTEPARAIRRYDWPTHAADLRAHPGQWLLLESDISSAHAARLRAGTQPDLAPLLGHLDVRMRRTRMDGAVRTGQLWARYSPREQITAQRNTSTRADAVTLTDDQVRDLREQMADRRGRLVREIAADFGVTPQYAGALARGAFRASAGGPIRGIDY